MRNKWILNRLLPWEVWVIRALLETTVQGLSHYYLALNLFTLGFVLLYKKGILDPESCIITNCLIGTIRKSHSAASLDYPFVLTLLFLPFLKSDFLFMTASKASNPSLWNTFTPSVVVHFPAFLFLNVDFFLEVTWSKICRFAGILCFW